MILSSSYPDVPVPHRPLAEFVLQRCAELGDKPALIDGPTGRTLTYAGLAAGVERFSANLVARGFGPGEVFAIFLPNLPEYAIAFLGTAAAGGVVTTANPTYTAEELEFQLRDSGARYLLTIPMFLPVCLEAAAAVGLDEVFVLGEASAGATPFTALLDPAPPPVAVPVDPTSLAVLPYSSGTTGLPKGVMLTHDNLVANLVQTEVLIDVTEDEVLIGVLPFFHIYGMNVIMNLTLYRGGTVVTMPRFDMEQFLELVQSHSVTLACLVPPIILGLAKLPVVADYDLSSLRLVFSGAAPLSAELAAEAAARLGCRVVQGYGLTETSPVTHSTPHAPGSERPGSVGVSLPGTECRIVDPVTGVDAAVGETGELWIRGPQVMVGYLNNPAATAETIDGDGWLHTGDIARVDEEGYYYIVDRLKELIKYKGFQVPPAELEALLLTHPAVGDAAVIPLPDPEAGEIPKAFVVLKPGREAGPDELMDFVSGHVAHYKQIRRLEIVPEIPKSASGKILRRVLRDRERARLAGETP